MVILQLKLLETFTSVSLQKVLVNTFSNIFSEEKTPTILSGLLQMYMPHKNTENYLFLVVLQEGNVVDCTAEINISKWEGYSFSMEKVFSW